MGPLGVPELIFIFVLALLILGPKKLPELGRSIGKGMSEFRRASNELRNTFEREMHTLEREGESFKQEVSGAVSGASSDYPTDDYGYSYESTPSDSTSSVSAPQAAETKPASEPEGSEAKS
jgi:TatA/E family protein of Tat protein translocase